MSNEDMGPKNARLDEIENELENIHLEPYQRGVLLHEALDLCLELCLDSDWRLYKVRLEQLQQSELAKKKEEETG